MPPSPSTAIPATSRRPMQSSWRTPRGKSWSDRPSRATTGARPGDTSRRPWICNASAREEPCGWEPRAPETGPSRASRCRSTVLSGPGYRLADRSDEVPCAQRFARRPENGVVPVVASSGAEEGLLEVASGHFAREERLAAGYAGLEVVPQLSSYEVAEDVVVVVDRGDRNVDLGRPVRLVPAGWTIYHLQLLYEIPPKSVQVAAFGIGVELPLEVEHHERPASEHHPVRPLTPEDVLADLV